MKIIVKFADLSDPLGYLFSKKDIKVLVHYWSTALSEKVEEGNSFEECFKFQNIIENVNALADLGITPHEKLVHQFAKMFVEKRREEDESTPIWDELMRLGTWSQFVYEIPRVIRNNLLSRLEIFDLSKLAKENVRTFLAGFYILVKDDVKLLRYEIIPGFFDYLKKNANTFSKDELSVLYQIKVLVEAHKKKLTKALDLPKYSYDDISSHLAWISPPYASEEAFINSFDLQDKKQSRGETIVEELLVDRCRELGCTVTAEYFDVNLQRTLDFLIEFQGQKFVIEFDGQFHFIFKTDQNKYLPSKKERVRRQILNQHYSGRVFHTIFFLVLGYNGSFMAISREKAERTLDSAFHYFEKIQQDVQ